MGGGLIKRFNRICEKTAWALAWGRGGVRHLIFACPESFGAGIIE